MRNFGVCKIDAEQFEKRRRRSIDKQNESNVNSLIQHVAELHEWLSTYEGCWPARVYLNRYWRTRLVHRRSASDKVVKGATPAQKRVYLLRRQVEQRRSASAPGDDDKSDSTTSSSDSSDSVSDLCGRQQSEAPLCDEVHLNARQSSHRTADTEAVKQFLKSLKPCLESRLDVFIELGIRNHEALVAFLSWPPAAQAQWVDEENKALQLTRLERGALLVGCSMFAQSMLYGRA
ncbi:hypothetical protein BU15DRAFT_65096 [Melanogaster broomeanus]|nr:hypothetical protein BU15DRAFT_65096 [Melanogaster broomeanus]